MNHALGLIEVKGLANAVDAADVMAKAANVQLLGAEKARGFGWMTVKVEGDVGAVKAAVDAAKAKAIQNNSFISALVIPRPAQGLEKALDPMKTGIKIAVPADQETEILVEKGNPEIRETVTTEEVAEVVSTQEETSKVSEVEVEEIVETKLSEKAISEAEKEVAVSVKKVAAGSSNKTTQRRKRK